MKLINTKLVCRLIKVTLLALFVLSLPTSPVRAASIPILNPSFETGDAMDWTLDTASSGGYQSGDHFHNSGSGGYQDFSNPLPTPFDGNYYLNLQGGYTSPDVSGIDFPTTLTQYVGALAPNTTYTLTVAVGGGTFTPSPGNGTIALLNGTDDTGTVLATTSWVGATTFGQYNGTPQDFTINFTTGASVSGGLTVELETTSSYNDRGIDPGPPPTGNGQNANNGVNFDNVRLDEVATVPEPSTYALLVVALALLLPLSKRRLKSE